MKIAEIYSHLNGLEYIKVHLLDLWTEIEHIIMDIDAEKCKTKISKEKFNSSIRRQVGILQFVGTKYCI